MSDDVKVTLGFDLGAKGAACLLRGEAMEAYPLTLPKRGDPERAGWWWREAARILDTFHPTAVAYENPFFATKDKDNKKAGARGQSHNWIRRQEGILLAICDQREILCVGVPTQTVSSFAKRDGVPKWGKGERKDALRNGAVALGWPVESWSQDAIDALWVAKWMAAQPLEIVP